jgi:hypothetical protein
MCDLFEELTQPHTKIGTTKQVNVEAYGKERPKYA